MTPAAFQKLFEKKIGDIKRYARQDLPRHIGKLAVDHFRENFMQGGYMDDTLQPWKPSKRIGVGKGASAGYGTLLSARKELYNSIRFAASEGKVVIISSLPHSKIHNEGGTISQNITVTPKMRRFAWAKHYEAGTADTKWKGLALTKKTSIARNITMPKRQYMGKSIELNRQIQERIMKDLKAILYSNN
jgi:phage gpG-like protein